MAEYDIVFIGAGPGGYVGAIRGAQRGAKVALVEKGEMGGVCLNRGCVPTKTLIASIGALRTAHRLGEFGVSTQCQPVPDLAAMSERRKKVVANLRKGVETLVKRNGIALIRGVGRLAGKNAVLVDTGSKKLELKTHNIVLATGGRAAEIPGIEADGEKILYSGHILEKTEIPERLLIIGAGAIGCEWACIYAALGTRVTLLEAMERPLPLEDEDISKILERELKKQKVKLKMGAKIAGLRAESDKITAALDNGDNIDADWALVSVGRKCNTSDLGLDEAGVEASDNGRIEVSGAMETSTPGIYAVGDITPGPMLAHAASAEGIIAAENSLRRKKALPPLRMDYSACPSVTFTYPEVASVGMTEQEALAEGIAVKTGWFAMRALGKAQAMGELAGGVKVVADERGKIIGFHIIGHGASNLIHEGALAVKYGLTVDQLASTIHAHPTFAEALVEAAEDANGSAIHIPPK